MTRLSSSFARERELIIVEAEIAGPATATEARLVLDTGAAATTLVPEVIERIGYARLDFEIRSAERRILVELINR
jgi:predicted aspartyl protease